MTKTTNTVRVGLLSAGLIMALFFVSFVSVQKAQAATLTSQMSYGSTGSSVTNLQQFLATNSMIYPQGIVSGYFGGLTRAAVVQFQAAYDISQVGNVGPITLAKMNNIILSGLGLDISAPSLLSIAVQTSNTSATISWSTNELARGQVYFDTIPLVMVESSRSSAQPYVSGTPVTNSYVASYSQSVTIQDLHPNTLYYYLIDTVDNSGNVTVTTQNFFYTK